MIVTGCPLDSSIYPSTDRWDVSSVSVCSSSGDVAWGCDAAVDVAWVSDIVCVESMEDVQFNDERTAFVAGLGALATGAPAYVTLDEKVFDLCGVLSNLYFRLAPTLKAF